MTKALLLTTVTSAALILFGQAAFAQVAQILPANSAETLANGVNAEAVVMNPGICGFRDDSPYLHPTMLERHFWSHHCAFVSPYFMAGICGPCMQSNLVVPRYAVGSQPLLWY